MHIETAIHIDLGYRWGLNLWSRIDFIFYLHVWDFIYRGTVGLENFTYRYIQWQPALWWSGEIRVRQEIL